MKVNAKIWAMVLLVVAFFFNGTGAVLAVLAQDPRSFVHIPIALCLIVVGVILGEVEVRA